MPTNILVTSAGTASAVNVIKALRSQQDVSVQIWAVDVDPMAAGLYLADGYALVPRCSSPDYVPALLQLCQIHQIQALFPIYSKEIEIIARHAQRFEPAGVAVLLPEPEIIQRCNDKAQMYELVQGLGVRVPQTVTQQEPLRFPLLAKPNTASGTTGVIKIDSPAELEYARQRFPELLYQEFIEGPEYTVDILCDRQHRAIALSPRLRLATKAGQSVKGRTVHNPTIDRICETICQAVGMVGPCNIQLIGRENEFVFIELNPRYAAGGLMLTVHAGANLPLLALKIMLDKPVDPPEIKPDVVMLRYWEEIFLG